MTLRTATYRVPGGRLAVVVDSRAPGDRPDVDYGALVVASFVPLADRDYPHLDATRIKAGHVPEVREAIAAYADGDLAAIDALSVAQPGGPFMQSAWRALRKVPAGSVVTYATLARRAGSPRAHRAAGTACSSNLVALVVPCHRVLASDGIGGYGYGVPVKLDLLEHEGALL